MEGNEIEKAAEKYAATIWTSRDPIFQLTSTMDFKAGANWQKERENAELTRALARIEELTTQNLDLVRKYDDLYRKANGQ